MIPFVSQFMRLKKGSRRSVFITLLTSYIIILLFPVVIGGVLYSQVEKVTVDQANRSNLAMLEQLRLSMDNSVKEVDQLSEQISLNPKMDLLLNNDITDDPYKYIEFISDYLDRYRTFSGRFIEDYYVYFKGSDAILKPGVRTDSKTFYNSYYSYKDMDYESWRKEVLESNHNRDYLPTKTLIRDGGLPITASLERQPIQVLTYVQSLIPVRGMSEIKGSLVVLIDERQVKEMIRQIESANQGNIYIVGADQKVLTGTTDQVPLSKEVLGRMQDHSGFFPYKDHGSDLMVSYTSSTQIGWKYISVMPRDLYMQKVNTVKLTAIWLFLLCLIGGFMASYFMAYRSYRPLKQMLMVFVKGQALPQSHKSFNEYEYIQDLFESVLTEQRNLQGVLNQQTPVMRANFLSRLIRGLVDPSEDISHSLDYMNIQFVSGSFAVILIQVDQIAEFCEEQSERQWAFIRFIISNICDDLIHEYHVGFCVELDRDRLVMLVNFKENRLNEAIPDMEQMVGRLKQVVEHRFKIAITLAVSNIHDGWERIGNAYLETLAAMEYQMIKGKNAVIYFHEINCKQQHYYYPMETEMQLVNYVRSGDVENVGQLLNNLYELNFTSNPITPGLARCLFFDLVSTYLKLINVIKVRHGLPVDGQFDAIPALLACATAEEMHEQIKQMLLSLTLSVKTDRGEHHDQLLQEMKVFIEMQHTDPDLGLGMIADRFSRSPQYVSTFFKKTSGEKITDYIAKCRIEHAKRLISSKDLTVAQIARQVGYANDLVFIRVFKKMEGITPGKYRDSC